jgi:hypothetical protein
MGKKMEPEQVFDSFVHKISEVIGESFHETRLLLKEVGSFDDLITSYLAGRDLGIPIKRVIALRKEGDKKVCVCKTSKYSGMKPVSEFN